MSYDLEIKQGEDFIESFAIILSSTGAPFVSDNNPIYAQIRTEDGTLVATFITAWQAVGSDKLLIALARSTTATLSVVSGESAYYYDVFVDLGGLRRRGPEGRVTVIERQTIPGVA